MKGQKKADAEKALADKKVFENSLAAGAAHNKQLFELNKAITVANILLDTPAAISSSFAYGASLGGPILGGAFAAIAAAAQGVQLGAALAASYGGRMDGGSVAAGGLYRVNEGGQSELLTVGDKQFLMMGAQGGQVTSANNMAVSGGKRVVVNVFPIEGETARVEHTSSDNVDQLDIFLERIEEGIAGNVNRGGTPLALAMESQYGLNRSAGGI